MAGQFVDYEGAKWPGEYTHFVVLENGRMDSGWEFKSDAHDRMRELLAEGRKPSVYSATFLMRKGLLTKGKAEYEGPRASARGNRGFANAPPNYNAPFHVVRIEDSVVLGSFATEQAAKEASETANGWGSPTEVRRWVPL